jgi:hypothetical protein
MNRKSFIKRTIIGGAAIGYSGFVAGRSVVSPKEAYSRPFDLKQKGIIGDYHQTGGPWWHINDEGVYANQGGSN